MASVKKRVKKAAGYRCEKCNAKPSDRSSLHAHHIVPEREGGETSEENLVALCSSCHRYAPDLNLITGSYEVAFEEFCETGMRPEMDMMLFGFEAAARFDLPPEYSGSWWMDVLQSGSSFFIGTEVASENSGFIDPAAYWVFGAAMADHGRVSEYLPVDLLESVGQFELLTEVEP